MGNLASAEHLEAGAHADIGGRPTMEDEHIVDDPRAHRLDLRAYVLFDGHGGRDAAVLAADTMVPAICARWPRGPTSIPRPLAPEMEPSVVHDTLERAFADCDQQIRQKGVSSGCTALVLLLPLGGSTAFCIAHAGDSRGVLCSNGRAVPLTEDHKPNDPAEKERIKEAGGCVLGGRVDGELAVSRSLGDWSFKPAPGRHHVSGVPEVALHSVKATDEFVILACDGLWDVMSNNQAVAHVLEVRHRGGSAASAAKRLVKKATRARPFAGDNVSVIVVYFREHPGKHSGKRR